MAENYFLSSLYTGVAAGEKIGTALTQKAARKALDDLAAHDAAMSTANPMAGLAGGVTPGTGSTSTSSATDVAGGYGITPGTSTTPTATPGNGYGIEPSSFDSSTQGMTMPDGVAPLPRVGQRSSSPAKNTPYQPTMPTGGPGTVPPGSMPPVDSTPSAQTADPTLQRVTEGGTGVGAIPVADAPPLADAAGSAVPGLQTEVPDQNFHLTPDQDPNFQRLTQMGWQLRPEGWWVSPQGEVWDPASGTPSPAQSPQGAGSNPKDMANAPMTTMPTQPMQLNQPQPDSQGDMGAIPEQEPAFGEAPGGMASSSSISSRPLSPMHQERVSAVLNIIAQGEAAGLPAFQGMTAYARQLGFTMPGEEVQGAEGQDGVQGSAGGDVLGASAGAAPGAQADPSYQMPEGPVDAGFVVDRFEAHGLPRHVAIGFAANVAVESGFNPAVDTGDGGHAWGLFQHNDRREAMVDWVTANYGDWRNPEGQIAFAMHELQTTERGAYEKIMQARSPEEAAELISRYFERPGTPHMEQRLAAARQIAAQYA